MEWDPGLVGLVSFVFTLSRTFLLGVGTKRNWHQAKLKTMLIQNFGMTNEEHYGMLWYFLKWSINLFTDTAAILN